MLDKAFTLPVAGSFYHLARRDYPSKNEHIYFEDQKKKMCFSVLASGSAMASLLVFYALDTYVHHLNADCMKLLKLLSLKK